MSLQVRAFSPGSRRGGGRGPSFPHRRRGAGGEEGFFALIHWYHLFFLRFLLSLRRVVLLHWPFLRCLRKPPKKMPPFGNSFQPRRKRKWLNTRLKSLSCQRLLTKW